MQYMLLIYSGNSMGEFEKLPEDEQKAVLGEYYAISETPGVSGGNQLQPAETATTVRVENGQSLITDGPFVESKEYLAGFWIIEAPDLDLALKLATEGSKACNRKVEVRPFQ